MFIIMENIRLTDYGRGTQKIIRCLVKFINMNVVSFPYQNRLTNGHSKQFSTAKPSLTCHDMDLKSHEAERVDAATNVRFLLRYISELNYGDGHGCSPACQCT